MKKLMILILVLAVMTSFASVMYQNTSGGNIVFDGKLIKASETVVYSHFVYSDDLTVIYTDVEPIVLRGATWDASNAVAATPVTHEVTVNFLADTLIEVTVTSGTLEIYFNNLQTIPFTVTEDFTYTLNTMWYDRIILKAATPTQTEYRITRKF